MEPPATFAADQSHTYPEHQVAAKHVDVPWAQEGPASAAADMSSTYTESAPAPPYVESEWVNEAAETTAPLAEIPAVGGPAEAPVDGEWIPEREIEKPQEALELPGTMPSANT
jgi:hypothetical protein